MRVGCTQGIWPGLEFRMIVDQFYINGEWTVPDRPSWLALIDPATEAEVGKVALGSNSDVLRAVAAAKAALPTFSSTTPKSGQRCCGGF